MKKLSTGNYVEEYAKSVFEELFEDTYRESTEEEDRLYGTDFFIGDVPIDITISKGKDRCRFVKKYVLEGITVSVLRRYGNARETFQRPVFVFEFETYDLRDRMVICELIEENLTKDIIAEILGLYN